MTERTEMAAPLNAQVAIALGWTDVTWDETGAYGRPPGGGGPQQVPRYGVDTPDGWACTGPLVSEYRLEVILKMDRDGTLGWSARGTEGPARWAPSAPEAIARLVVRLADMGKLVKA